MDKPAGMFRFRYRLRTLLLVVTVISFLFGLGWNVNRVSQRQSLLKSITDRGALIGSTESASSSRSLPAWWTLLGAKRVEMIELPDGMFSDAEINRIASLFPEAVLKHHSTRIDNNPRIAR